jgi:hypothetical protein
MHVDLGGLHGVRLVVNGRCGACEIENLVHFHVQRIGDVMPVDLEIGIVDHVDDVALCARVEIVDAQDIISILQEALTKMRAQEARATSYGTTFSKMHVVFLFLTLSQGTATSTAMQPGCID